jgi:hypothetical protein
MAAGRLPAPPGVGRVGAAVLGAAEADVEDGAVRGAVERVAAAAAAVGPRPLPIEQVALLLLVVAVAVPRRRRGRLGRDGDPAGPERPGGQRAAEGRRAAEQRRSLHHRSLLRNVEVSTPKCLICFASYRAIRSCVGEE